MATHLSSGWPWVIPRFAAHHIGDDPVKVCCSAAARMPASATMKITIRFMFSRYFLSLVI
jgi:hypothetical protein